MDMIRRGIWTVQLLKQWDIRENYLKLKLNVEIKSVNSMSI